MAKLTDVRIHNHAHFVKHSTPRREKILMAMQEPDKLKLTEADEHYMEQCTKAFTIMSSPNRSMAKNVNMIAAACNVTTRQAYNIINDASYIFGNVVEVNRLFLKTQRREALLKILRKLEEMPKPDYKLILEANKLLIVLDDLPKALPDAEKEDVEDLTIPQIQFTDDYSVLEEAEIVNDAENNENEEE